MINLNIKKTQSVTIFLLISYKDEMFMMHAVPPMKYFYQNFKSKSDQASGSNYEPVKI